MGWWRGSGASKFRLPGAEVGGASTRLVSDKRESCESLDTLSLGLSYKKKLLVPLQVSKQSVSLRIFSHPITRRPSPKLKPEVLADLSNFLPVCPILLLPCFCAACVSSSRSAVNFALDLIIPLFSFNFFLALVFFKYSGQLLSSSFLFSLQSASPGSLSILTLHPTPPGQAWVYTYHAKVDGRVGLWHRQIVEGIEHVIQVIFLGGGNKQEKIRRKTH